VWEESLGWGNQERYMTDESFQQKQLRETEIMALKSINHPCVIIWGFLNECVSQLDTSRPLIGSLSDMLHKVDPTRPVTYATYRMQNDRCLDLVDIISFNTYPGWYICGEDQFFTPEKTAQHLDELVEFVSREEYKDKPFFISEVGAEAMPGFLGGQRWSEEYQADLQEFVLRHIQNNSRFSGVWFWQYCDARTYVSNASQGRPMGFNFKGLVDGHRRPKMAWKRLSEILKKNK
jgi:beta-glucuronidase